MIRLKIPSLQMVEKVIFLEGDKILFEDHNPIVRILFIDATR